jgi:hypothetical protein
MADDYKFPMRLRCAMERAATVLTNSANIRRRELDEDDQALLRGVLDDLDSACIEANMVLPTRLAPRAAPCGQFRVRLGHSTGYDYQTQLYDVVRGLGLPSDVTVSLPHENGAAGDCTKSFFAGGCDLFIAEVSAASTGLGMEIAYADMHGVPVAGLYRAGSTPSSAIKMVTPMLLSYDSPEQLARHIESLISAARR